MDLIEQHHRWHRRFADPLHSGPQTLLLAEREPLLFESPVVQALSTLLRQGRSLREHLTTASTSASHAMFPALLQALSSLRDAGHVQDEEAHASAPYHLPDFDAALAATPHAVEGTRVWCLSPAFGDARIAACVRAAQGEGARMTWVFCDDLLDPRLADIDAWHRTRGLPWLLLRMTGEQPSIGPVFDPAMPDDACWHCLATRLRRQHAARTWAQRRIHASGAHAMPALLPIPVLSDPQQLDARIGRISPALLQGLATPSRQHILTWRDTAFGQVANASEQVVRHLLVKLPQCTHCGDPGLRARRQLEPIALASRPTINDAPGGSRCAPPERLTASQDRLVSALLGPILEVARVETPHAQQAPDSDTPLTIYRSAFIRPPAPGAALPRDGFVQTCLGKGRTASQSQASALGEAIERLSAAWHGDEATIVASALELGASAITPAMLPRVKPAHDASSQAPEGDTPPFDPAAPMRWAPAWSLTHGERRHLPAAYCFRDMPAEDCRHIAWTSNGCAAGSNREEAILQGLLEVIERDATAIWWYGMAPRPAWPEAHLPAGLIARLTRQLNPPRPHPSPSGQPEEEGAWRLWTLDLTHDLGIPVAAAVAHRTGPDPSRDDWALGFGCHLSPTLAAERALTELAQLIAVGKYLRVVSTSLQFLQIAHKATRIPHKCPDNPPMDIADQIRFLVAQLDARGFEVIVLDHTQPDLPLHAVKTTVPGLCHIWPEAVPSARLMTVPAGLNWLTEPAKASQLNPQPLFV